MDSPVARIPEGPNMSIIMKGESQVNVYNPMVLIMTIGVSAQVYVIFVDLI